MDLTRPSITRLARRAGVKSIAEECFPYIRSLITQRVGEILDQALIVNSEKQTKTLMVSDIYDALRLTGENVAQSEFLNTVTVNK